MVGLIHKVFFDLVRSIGGEDAVTEVRRRAGVPSGREFHLNITYDDAEWRRLLQAARDIAGLTPEAMDEAYADAFARDALVRWPMWFEMADNSRAFIEMQPTIHNSLASGVADRISRQAIRDKFRVERRGSGTITYYRSSNRHCGLYKALARRIIEHYGDEATIDEPRCMHTGSSECEIHIHWTRLGTPA